MNPVVNQKFSHVDALAYLQSLQSRLIAIKDPVKYVAGFETDDGRQIGLELRGKKVKVFVEPGSWEELAPGVKLHKRYSASDGRNADLDANAPRLSKGNPALAFIIPSLAALTGFCDAYNLNSSTSTSSATIVPQHDSTAITTFHDSSFQRKPRSISLEDLLNILTRQRENGAAGELIAIEWEKKRIRDSGCATPDDFVVHTSKENVAAGFDIYSNWNSGHERFIEVKATASGAEYFFMSENEKQVLTDKSGKSYIYIVDLNSSSKDTGTVRTPIKFDETAFEFEPVAYRVRVKR